MADLRVFEIECSSCYGEAWVKCLGEEDFQSVAEKAGWRKVPASPAGEWVCPDCAPRQPKRIPEWDRDWLGEAGERLRRKSVE